MAYYDRGNKEGGGKRGSRGSVAPAPMQNTAMPGAQQISPMGKQPGEGKQGSPGAFGGGGGLSQQPQEPVGGAYGKNGSPGGMGGGSMPPPQSMDAPQEEPKLGQQGKQGSPGGFGGAQQMGTGVIPQQRPGKQGSPGGMGGGPQPSPESVSRFRNRALNVPSSSKGGGRY